MTNVDNTELPASTAERPASTAERPASTADADVSPTPTTGSDTAGLEAPDNTNARTDNTPPTTTDTSGGTDDARLVRDNTPSGTDDARLVRDNTPSGTGDTRLVRDNTPSGMGDTRLVRDNTPSGTGDARLVRDNTPSGTDDARLVRDNTPSGTGDARLVRDNTPSGTDDTAPAIIPDPISHHPCPTGDASYPPDDHILQMRAISKEFPGVKALKNVTLTVRRGEVHAICGENGAGKSTLMKVLSGVHPHGTYSGEIVFDGRVCSFHNIRESEKLGIVIIHQELALSPYLSIAENIFLGNERAKAGVIDWRQTGQEAQRLLKRVGLEENPDTRVMDIGVGKQQLVEIAKALSKDVRLLILDEPTAALNDDDSANLLQLLRQLRDQGITSIMISHKLSELEEIADTITIIRDGQTIFSLDMHDDGDHSQERIIRGMVGRPLENRFPEHAATVGEEVLRIEDWTVHHPIDTSRAIVKAASLHIRRGEIVGLAGLMGAGRTELAMSLFGRTYGSRISGRIFKDGQEITIHSVRDAMNHGIAYATEDRKRYGLNLIQTVKENTTAAGLAKLARFGVIETEAETGIAEGYRKELGIKAPTIEVPTSKLSGGNQQKVVLAKWIYTDPDVLILDEPTRGIDVGAKYEIYTIMDRLADQGKGILMISSELPELLGVCDRIYALSEGRITGCQTKQEATPESLMYLMTLETLKKDDLK